MSSKSQNISCLVCGADVILPSPFNGMMDFVTEDSRLSVSVMVLENSLDDQGQVKQMDSKVMCLVCLREFFNNARTRQT